MLRRLVGLLIALVALLLSAPLPTPANETATPIALHTYDEDRLVAMAPAVKPSRGPPHTRALSTCKNTGDRGSPGASARPDVTPPVQTTAHTTTAKFVQGTQATGTTTEPLRLNDGDLSPLQRLHVAANAGTELRKVGSVLETVDDVMANPALLKGRHPALVENILKGTPGWQVEKLGRGSQAGRGWVFRQYTPAGNPTGQQLRWHPGGGHHGPDPYWRVVGPNGDLGGIIR